jgi:hypothetical protein
MTSRQPDTDLPGTSGSPQVTGSPGAAGAPGRDPEAAQLWLLRLLPLALLIILGLAGLRGAVGTLHWNGPLRRDEPGIGTVLGVVLIAATVITVLRMRRGNQEPVARKLRGVLLFTELAGVVTVAAITLAGLHLHLFGTGGGQVITRPTPTARPRPSGRPGKTPTGPDIHISAAVLLYILLVVVLLAAIAICVWYARRLRPPVRPSEDDFIVEDAKDLRDAVEEGRSALRTSDDARAAIIACYVAMENRLGERGAARALADTPDELLARARDSGVVSGTAAARLTALFYEARFSSHPLASSQRDAAAAALDELADALSDDRAAAAGPAGDGS